MSTFGHTVDSPKIRELREALHVAHAAADEARREADRAAEAYSASLRVSNAAYGRLMQAIEDAEAAERRHASDVNLGRKS